MLVKITTFVPDLLMKRIILLLIATLGVLALSNFSLAQSGRVKDPAETAVGATKKPDTEKPSEHSDTRTAAQLFEEADTYTQRRFAEFEKQKMPFDQRLEEKIKQEQRDLASKHATVLAARKLEGQDVY
jgi:hypothetical protein